MPKIVNLTRIDLEDQELQHIPLVEGEEKAERVLLNNNQIYNIENLVSLPVISYLNLSNNLIHKVNHMDNMGSLKELRLDNNFIENLSDLSSLTRLEKLSVRNNKLKSVNGLHKLQWLTHLNVSSNLLPMFDVQGLCPSLEILDCSLNKLTSLASIQRYTHKLKELNVQQNPLEKDGKGKLVLNRFPELLNLRIDGYLERIIEGLEEDCAINGKYIFKMEQNPGITSEVQKSLEGKLKINQNIRYMKDDEIEEEKTMPITPVHSLKPIEIDNNPTIPNELKILENKKANEFKKKKEEVKESKSLISN